MCIVKDKIESSSFLYLEPWFYNNELSIRCELGIGYDNEYFINAENRALEILDIKIKIIDAIKQMFKNQSYVYHFVSYKNNLIYSIYDDRGCDIVFFKKEDYKKYYSKLEKYFLEYDKELMEKRLKAL